MTDDGVVLLDGTDLSQLSARELARVRRRRIGFVFQFFHLMPTLTVTENIALPLILDRDDDPRQQALDMASRVGLSGRETHMPAELSGGEMQRCAIGRALVNHPAIVFADEPTGNLDSRTGRQIVSLLTEQVREFGTALLIATHDASLAKRADRVVTVRDGRLHS